MKIPERLKSITRQEKWMIVIIIILLAGVIVRRNFIGREAGDAFRQRLEHFRPDEKPEPAPETDSAGWNVVRDTVKPPPNAPDAATP